MINAESIITTWHDRDSYLTRCMEQQRKIAENARASKTVADSARTTTQVRGMRRRRSTVAR